MTHNDRPKFATLMKALGETFGNTIPSKEKMEIYFRALSEFTIEQIDQAVLHLVKTRTITTTFPVPGEISVAIGGDSNSAAIIALDKAEKAVERYGSYRSVQFDDPIIHMVITTMGGWYKFCCPAAYGDTQDWHWKQKEFKSIYEAFSHRPTAECPLVLFGICDTESSGVGKPPELIGDRKKIEQWTQASRVGLPTIKNQKNRREATHSIGREKAVIT